MHIKEKYEYKSDNRRMMHQRIKVTLKSLLHKSVFVTLNSFQGLITC